LDSLVRLYRQTERWDQLLRALETKREQVEDPAERSALEVERAELQLERLDDAEGALETYRAVLERDPDCDEALQGLRSLVERTDVGDRATDLLAERLRENEQWIQLRELLESRIESVDDPHRLAERYRELARVLEERLDNPDMAFIALGRGLNHTPGEEELRADLRRLGEELDNGEDLYALYEDAIDGGVEDESTRLALHREAADIAEEQLEDVDAAIDHARTTLELDEEHLPTLEQLDRLYQRQHAWGDLADILQRQLDLAGGDEAPELEYRLGYLFEQYLGDRRRALESYRRALEDEPGQVGVVEGLERLIDDEELRGEVRYADLVDLLDRRREVVEGDGRRAELLLESAQIRIERLDEFELGWANLSRALRAEPGADDVLERLEATADEYGRHEELVALLEEVAEESSDPVTSARLLRRAGRRAREELDDAEWAARLFRRAHDSEPDDREALEGFESVARELDDPSSLVEALRRRAETSYEPDDRRQAFLEIGEIEADRGRTEEAIDAYREALELDETDRRAMRSLVDLYEETDRHAELVRTLERLERTVDDPDELTEIHEKIARYSRSVLEDLDRAIEATRSILRFEPDHRAALEELEDLYRETEQWENLRDVLVREFEIAEADDRPSDARRAARQLAELSRDRFEDVGDAIHWFERAAEFAEAGEEIESSLAELYGRAERWGALAELYESRYERADVDDERLEAALQLSRLCLSRLGDFARAEEYLERAENIAGPETEVLDLKADLHRELGRWDELAGLLDRRASAAESAERELELRLERGELLRSRLDSAAAAVEEFERALEVDPDDERAMAALDDLYRQLGRSADRFDILAHHVQHADDPDVRADLAVDMADLARVGQGDRLTAIEALESALDRAPADPQVARPLVRLLEEQGEFDRASEVVEQLLEEGDLPDDERVRLLHARGQLAEQDDRPEDALEQYRAGVEVDDAHLPNLMSLGKLEYRLEEYEQARERFQQLLLHQMKLDSDEKKVQVYYHLGLVESELGNDRRARDMFDRALGVDPDHEPSKRAKEALG
ncbi:MAG: tetratricopeptide repeat protein, partial [Bradymonadaceae bacterium]